MSEAPPSIPDYVLLRPVGRGAFGEVWLARAVTGQLRAVKVLHRIAMSHERAFEREFEGVVRYENISRTQPNLVQVLHVGRTQDGQSFWYVMELADDASLSANEAAMNRASASHAPDDSEITREDLLSTEDRIAAYSPRTLRAVLRARGRLPVAKCLSIAIGLTDAVAHLHALGLVHRDIKPSNVIFVNGLPKLADIGLVTSSDEQPSIVGTAGYIPPDGAGTPAADIYALGKVLYEMATGRDLRDFPKLPQDFMQLPDRAALVEFNEILVRASDPDSRRRYGTIEELRSDLLLLEAGRSVRRLRGIERRLRLAARAGAAVTAVAVVAIAAGLWANHERVRAVKAERELSVRFVGQQLALARATRLTGLPGQREQTLGIVREAARRTNSLALRNEAVAALGLPDAHHWQTLFVPHVQVAFDPLMTRYATNDRGGNIHVRALDDNRPIAFLPANRQPLVPSWLTGLHLFGFSPDGESIGASYTNHQFLIWSLRAQPSYEAARQEGWSALEQPESSRPRVIALPFGVEAGVAVPGTRQFATDSRTGTLHFFDVDSCQKLRVLPGKWRIDEIEFSPDGLRFARRRDATVTIHDTATGYVLRSVTANTAVGGMAWHPDGRQLVTWSAEKTLQIWDTELERLCGVLAAHEAVVIGAAFDATGQWLVTTSWDNQTILWSVAQQRPLLRLPGAGNELQFSRDARRLRWRSWDNERMEVFELPPARELTRNEQHPALGGEEGLRSLWSVVFLHETDLLVGVGEKGFSAWQPPAAFPAALANQRVEHVIQASPHDGLLTAGSGGLLHWPAVVNASSNTTCLGPPTALTPREFSPVAAFAVSSNGARTVIRSAARGLFLKSEPAGTNWLRLTRQPVYALTAEASGRWIAATFISGGIRVWDAADGKVLTNLPSAFASTCRFSPDGSWLITGTAESYQIWTTLDWRLTHQLSRQAGGGPVLCWSPDGQLLLVHDTDTTVRLLKTGTWEEAASLPAPRLLREPAFSPDSTRLALPGEKSGVEVWNLRELRRSLSEVGLDWDAPPFPPLVGETRSSPAKVRIITAR